MNRSWSSRRAATCLTIGALGLAPTVVLAETGPPSAAVVQSMAAPVFSTDTELLLQVLTDRHVLSDGIIGYADPLGAYLPVGELARLLDLAIPVEASAGRADGWFLSPTRTLVIDVAAGFVEVEGRRTALSAREAVMHEGELYVRAQALASWLPLDITVDSRDSVIRLRTREPFPFESRADRESSRDRLAAGPAQGRQAVFETTPYRLFTPPAVDLQARVATESGALATTYDVRASGDALGLSADAFAQGDQDEGIRALRLTLGRRAAGPEVDASGSGLTEFALGDVFSPSLPLAARAAVGRGIFVSNAPVDQPSVFQRTELRGELPLGFEVELYRNDVLIGSRSPTADGRYEFLDVPLEYGLNILRLVFYGPRGETREDIRRVRVGNGQVPKGETRVIAGLLQQDTPLFDLGGLRASDVDDGALRGVASIEHGLSEALTVTAGAAVFSHDGQQRSSGLAGLRTGWGGSTIQADVAAQQDGAGAMQVGVAGTLAGWSYILKHAEYSGRFADETRFETAGYLSRSTGLRVDGALRLPGPAGAVATVGTSFAADMSERIDGFRDFRGSLRNSAPWGDLLLSNTLSWSRLGRADAASTRVHGDFDAFGRFDAWTVRVGLGYELAPEPRFSVIDYSIDRPIGDDVQFRAFASQRLFDDRGARLGVSVAKLFSAFDIAVDAQFDTATSEYVLGLRLGVGFGWDDRDGRYRPARAGVAGGGALSADVFRDLNGDGVRGAGEPGIAGAVLQGPTGSTRSDERGRALLADLGEGPAVVTLDAGSLGDPYLAPARDAVAIAARPGRAHSASFAVVATGEAEGRAVFVDEGGERPVSSVALILVDQTGKATAPKRTEYDGYVLFDRIPPGTWTVALDPEQASRLGLELTPQEPFVVGADGGVVDIGTMRLRSARPESRSAAGDRDGPQS